MKVIEGLLTKREFLLNIADSLESGYFENTSHKWICDKILFYYDTYHTNPTMEFISAEVKKVENDVLRIAITEALKEIYTADSSDLSWVEKEFTQFCMNQQIKKAITTSIDLLNIGDYDGIKSLINKALRAGEERNLGHMYEADVESRYRADDRKCIPFPWPVFNEMTQGGMGKGDLVLIFGNPGGGKTWAAIACGAYAAACGYNVVHYTLELSEGYVGKRYDAVLTGIDLDKLDKNRNHVEEVIKKLNGRLVIKEFPPKRASLDTIESHLNQLEQQHDFIPDFIIIDYLDYLRPSKSHTERKDDIDDVYIEAKGLAKTRGIPILSPSQANRSGSEESIIEGNKAAGSYDKIMVGDIILSLARGRKNKLNGTGLWHWIKNRYGPDGITFGSKINTSNGKIIINDTPMDDDDITSSPKPKSKNSSIDIDDDEINTLRNRFKTLHNE